MDITSLDTLDAIGMNITPKQSDFALYMTTGKPLIRSFSWFGGGIQLVMTTLKHSQPIQSLAASDAWLAGKSDPAALAERTVSYLAVASVDSLLLNGKAVLVPGQAAETWRNSDAFDSFVSRLNPDQLELVRESYKLLRQELDGLRSQLTLLA